MISGDPQLGYIARKGKKMKKIVVMTLCACAFVMTACANDVPAKSALETETAVVAEAAPVEVTAKEDVKEAEAEVVSEKESAEDTVEEKAAEAEASENAEEKEEEKAAEETEKEVSAETAEAPAKEAAPEYTLTEMDAVMYAQQQVNTRKGPGTSYEKAGSFNKGDKLHVVAKASTGWYQLEDGNFVTNSTKYVAEKEPAKEIVAVAQAQTAANEQKSVASASTQTTAPASTPAQETAPAQNTAPQTTETVSAPAPQANETAVQPQAAEVAAAPAQETAAEPEHKPGDTWVVDSFGTTYTMEEDGSITRRSMGLYGPVEETNYNETCEHLNSTVEETDEFEYDQYGTCIAHVVTCVDTCHDCGSVYTQVNRFTY
jgi:uncharacterized protein YgiM (DUF1202 family)